MPRRFTATMGMPVDADGINRGEDLTGACRGALLNMLALLQERGFTRDQAYVISSVAVDLRISNVVNAPNYVVSALLPERPGGGGSHLPRAGGSHLPRTRTRGSPSRGDGAPPRSCWKPSVDCPDSYCEKRSLTTARGRSTLTVSPQGQGLTLRQGGEQPWFMRRRHTGTGHGAGC
jgi:hypothetical protein